MRKPRLDLKHKNVCSSAKERVSVLPDLSWLKIGESYIEKGFIKASIKHFELFVEERLKEQLGCVEESVKIQLSAYGENVLEDMLNYKDNASVVNVTREVKERVLNRSIITNLKRYYNYRCQICEKQFRDLYSVDICEGHHIEYFAKHLTIMQTTS